MTGRLQTTTEVDFPTMWLSTTGGAVKRRFWKREMKSSSETVDEGGSEVKEKHEERDRRKG